MYPFFVKKEAPTTEAAPADMKEYLTRTGRPRSQGKKLLGALSANKMLIYALLLR